jgi:hypothetical protein
LHSNTIAGIDQINRPAGLMVLDSATKITRPLVYQWLSFDTGDRPLSQYFERPRPTCRRHANLRKCPLCEALWTPGSADSANSQGELMAAFGHIRAEFRATATDQYPLNVCQRSTLGAPRHDTRPVLDGRTCSRRGRRGLWRVDRIRVGRSGRRRSP